MRSTSRFFSLAGLAAAALIFVSACSASATPAATVLAATAAPTDTAAPAATSMATPAAAGLTIGMTNDAKLGAYLTGAKGMTLYVFTDDKMDTSACTGGCANYWPPLTVAAGTTITPPSGATGTFSLVARADGTMQVAYNHQPLYYFASDSAAGDTKGQGLNGKWFVAPLSGNVPTPVVTAPPAAKPTKTTSGY
jgi:predicted lipoprotein with Yx(FWY)xxD motif